MKHKLRTPPAAARDADLPPEEIHLPACEWEALKAAIPFHHSPAQQELPQPVTAADPAPAVPAVATPRRKWHVDHDAMLAEGGFDTDVVTGGPARPAPDLKTPL